MVRAASAGETSFMLVNFERWKGRKEVTEESVFSSESYEMARQ